MLRAAVNVLTSWLTTFLNAIQQLQYFSLDLRCGLIVPIYKRGKPVGMPKSYRPVMLLSVVHKVLTSILTHRASNGIEEYVRETQVGFRSGRSTAYGVFYARILCERSLLGNWTYSAALLDFSGAFDTVVRQTALDRMHEANIATRTTAALISQTTARVNLNGHLSTLFPTNIGVVQGDPLSPTMYVICAEPAMRKLDPLCLSTLPAVHTQYADNTMLHAEDQKIINKLVPKCEPIFAADNLCLNAQKTEYLTVTKQDSSWCSVKLLGSLLGSEEDIKTRISAANRAFSSIQWQRHCLTSRLCMLTVLIITVLLDNCALWTLSRKVSESLDVNAVSCVSYSVLPTHTESLTTTCTSNLTTFPSRPFADDVACYGWVTSFEKAQEQPSMKHSS